MRTPNGVVAWAARTFPVAIGASGGRNAGSFCVPPQHVVSRIDPAVLVVVAGCRERQGLQLEPPDIDPRAADMIGVVHASVRCAALVTSRHTVRPGNRGRISGVNCRAAGE